MHPAAVYGIFKQKRHTGLSRLNACEVGFIMENDIRNICDILDPFAKMLGLTVAELREDGLTAEVKINPNFCNTYSAAHGGFAYSIGQIAAVLSAELCLDRQMTAADVSTMYVCSLMGKRARIRTRLIDASSGTVAYRVRVLDTKGKLCLSQIVTLRDAVQAGEEPREFRRTIFAADENTPVDPVTGVAYPHLSVFFPAMCGVHILGRGEKGLIYGADIRPDTCDSFGAAHSSLIYTLCDCVSGGSAFFLMDIKPVTVSSSIRYIRSATVGPVKAEARLIRRGKQLLFYDVDVFDGSGQLVAVSHFVLHSVEYKARRDLPPEHRIHAFKD